MARQAIRGALQRASHQRAVSRELVEAPTGDIFRRDGLGKARLKLLIELELVVILWEFGLAGQVHELRYECVEVVPPHGKGPEFRLRVGEPVRVMEHDREEVQHLLRCPERSPTALPKARKKVPLRFAPTERSDEAHLRAGVGVVIAVIFEAILDAEEPSVKCRVFPVSKDRGLGHLRAPGRPGGRRGFDGHASDIWLKS